MVRRHLAAIAAMTLLAGCGQTGNSADGLTAKERQQLDNAAAMVGDQTIDTSPDSLVPEEGAVPINGAAPTAPAGAGNTTANGAAAR